MVLHIKHECKGAFVNTNGELVKYEITNNDGQWELTSVDKIGNATALGSYQSPACLEKYDRCDHSTYTKQTNDS